MKEGTSRRSLPTSKPFHWRHASQSRSCAKLMGVWPSCEHGEVGAAMSRASRQHVRCPGVLQQHPDELEGNYLLIASCM